MAELQYLVKPDWSIAYVIINGEPLFRALDISKILGYIDSGSMMLSCHVSSHDRISLDDVYNRSSPLINTSGLTKIMHHSTKKNKFALNAWLVKKELPKLIKTDDQLNDEGNDDQPNDDCYFCAIAKKNKNINVFNNIYKNKSNKISESSTYL